MQRNTNGVLTRRGLCGIYKSTLEKSCIRQKVHLKKEYMLGIVAHPTIVSRHLINFDLGKRFTQEGVYEPFLYYADLFVL